MLVFRLEAKGKSFSFIRVIQIKKMGQYAE